MGMWTRMRRRLDTSWLRPSDEIRWDSRDLMGVKLVYYAGPGHYQLTPDVR